MSYSVTDCRDFPCSISTPKAFCFVVATPTTSTPIFRHPHTHTVQYDALPSLNLFPSSSQEPLHPHVYGLPPSSRGTVCKAKTWVRGRRPSTQLPLEDHLSTYKPSRGA
ncbi:hypothetical protein KQX54_020822 [Cotesia glomerata]|uniref:Uncharacterized protein n=1 Tax=Cotesia glomerata TaxID=32391 RepID=A0AAV7I2T0_COTGL|nr:hypothetical protein KQX54_020822 [Cotesia glomerata]